MCEPPLKDITNAAMQLEDKDAERKHATAAVVPMEPCKKRAKYESDQWEAALQPELQMYVQLKHVLGAHYSDARQRLSLHHTSQCLWNLGHCFTNHVKHRAQPAQLISAVATSCIKDHIVEQRPNQFVTMIESTLMQRIFVGSELFAAGLELILTMNPVSEQLHEDYTVASVIQRTVDALGTCLDLFPPCRWDLRVEYAKLLVCRLEADCFERYNTRRELFPTVLSLLDDAMIHDRDAAMDTDRQRSRETRTAYQNYPVWFEANKQQYDFDRLPRIDQLERIFLVLHLLMKLLEDNLAIWLLRSPSKIAGDLTEHRRSPLIVSLIWQDDDNISINKMVQQMINMFVNAVALQYPRRDVEVLSRLMNLIAVAFELSTITLEANAICFPSININTERFADQIWITMQTSTYFSTHCCLNVIESIRTPVIRLLLTEKLLHKLNQCNNGRSVHGYLLHLRDRTWQGCSTEVRSVPAPKARYPVLDLKKSKRCNHDISETQYVDLLFIGFRAYCDFHQIPAFFRAMLQKVPDVATGVDSTTSGHFMVANVPDSPVLHKLNIDSKLLLQYREDLKHLVLMSDHLRQLEAPVDGLLDRWRKYLVEIDVSLL